MGGVRTPCIAKDTLYRFLDWGVTQGLFDLARVQEVKSQADAAIEQYETEANL